MKSWRNIKSGSSVEIGVLQLHSPTSAHAAVQAVHPHRASASPAVVTTPHSALIT